LHATDAKNTSIRIASVVVNTSYLKRERERERERDYGQREDYFAKSVTKLPKVTNTGEQ
jgi:hypothetical protein